MKDSHVDTRDQKFISEIQIISESIDSHRTLVGDDTVYQFLDKVKRITGSIAEIKKEGRLLKIGIVGCVKAGKSSFLNALVFDGNQILPKAPTPMTAALTKLSYSDTPEAKIVFYQPYDWKSIVNMDEKYTQAVDEEYKRVEEEYYKSLSINSTGYTGYTYTIPKPTRKDVEKRLRAQLSENLVASHELVSMVNDRHISPYDYLGKEEVITGDPNDSPSTYIAKLEEYVGANGKLTPLVNHIELVINNPLLDGFEIIDTPGLNDPIVSRGRATKDYLMNCDVVFIVCPVGQFLTSQDISLISNYLSQESVTHAYIIGSQLDSGILQYNRNEHSLQNAWNGSLNTYEAQAKSELGRLAQNNSSPLIQRLQESLPPEFVSSMIFSIAKKMNENTPLDSGEQLVLDNFKRRFTDFDEFMSSPADLYAFSNINGVKERVYDHVRKQKNSIINERIATYTKSQASELLRLLETINIVAKTNLENLRTGDVERLEEKLHLLNSKLDSIRLEISNIFDNQAAMCKRQIEGIKVEIGKEARMHSSIEVETRKEEKRDVEHYGLFGIMQRTTVSLVDKKTARASEAVENVRNYGTEAQSLINRNLERLFDIDGLKSKIKSCVIGAFDLADKKFNPDEILIPLATLLEKLSVDSISFDFITETEERIYGEFSTDGGIVEGNNIHKLYRLQEEEISRVLKLCSERLDELNTNISSEMTTQSGVFVDNIVARVSGNIELMKKLLANREENIALYEEFIQTILQHKKALYPFQE